MGRKRGLKIKSDQSKIKLRIYVDRAIYRIWDISKLKIANLMKNSAINRIHENIIKNHFGQKGYSSAYV